jgi:hypothetical protein
MVREKWTSSMCGGALGGLQKAPHSKFDCDGPVTSLTGLDRPAPSPVFVCPSVRYPFQSRPVPWRSVIDISDEDWQRLFAINVLSGVRLLPNVRCGRRTNYQVLFYLLHVCLHHMKR